MIRRHRWIIAALAAGAAIGAPLWVLRAGNAGDARAAMTRGLAALDKGDARTARVELMNAIKAEPGWAPARVAQARAFLALGDGVAARAELDRARASGARPATNRHLMAYALLLQGRPAEALKEAQASDIIPAQRGYATRIEGRALQSLGRLDAAQRAFARAVVLTPNDSDVWVDVARFRMETGDQAGAVEAASHAVVLNPRSTAALTIRAMLIREQYGLKASLPWFDRAVALDPNSVPALSEYAATLADSGAARRALSLTRRIIALEPDNARAFQMQAIMAARAGQDDLARSLLARTGGVLDGQPATLLLRGVLHAAGGNPTLAAEQLGRLLRLQPFNQRARLLLARACFDAGQYGAALDTLTPLTGRQDAPPYALILAGRSMEAMNDRAGAAELLARATRMSPPGAYMFAGAASPEMLAGEALARPDAAGPNVPYIRALLESGQDEAAVARARALLDANRGAPQAHVVLGDALLASGNPAAAAGAYEAAANLQFSEGVMLRLVQAWGQAGDPARGVQALGLYLTQNSASVEANRLASAAWIAAGNWDRATALLEQQRARVGNSDWLLMTDLAWAWLGKGDVHRAVSYARNAYRLQPASPLTADVYGWSLLQAGNVRQASVDLLEKAVALAPGNPMIRRHLAKAHSAVR